MDENIEKKYGIWTIFEEDIERSKRTKIKHYWCLCEHNNVSINSLNIHKIKNNIPSQCKCNIREPKKGDRYGKLILIERNLEEEKIRKVKGDRGRYYWCQCDCGSEPKTISIQHMKKGESTTCGCEQRRKKVLNKYDLTGKFGIGYDCHNRKFYFGLKDYNRIKNYTWNTDCNNYIFTNINRKKVYFHRFIFGVLSKDIKIDHINGYGSENDNRRENLRLCTHTQNMQNSRSEGIYYNKKRNKWTARITVNKKNIDLGVYENKDEALKIRREAEIKYFGEFAPIHK